MAERFGGYGKHFSASFPSESDLWKTSSQLEGLKNGIEQPFARRNNTGEWSATTDLMSSFASKRPLYQLSRSLEPGIGTVES